MKSLNTNNSITTDAGEKSTDLDSFEFRKILMLV
jgi:hypothetical protein